MSPQLTHEEIETRLRAAGWQPGRDAGAEAAELMRATTAGLAARGCSATPSPAAVTFLREFALLDLERPFGERTEHCVFAARFFSEGDAEAIKELSDDLRQPLFPVAFERIENGVVLIDPLNRFFYTHWSGPYYLGHGKYEVLSSLLTGAHEDAEEFFV
ncbi:SUKH-3 domain-containing protein [Streptomyces sp. LX-29]|uniref:SUKH-3 domain-containing protein n=1 Tax=Streptomyces sp. LX-29 TaxID=2900152 RepID=UPI00240D83EF|nr:SUKH-3 domain-containing protein [Streptomyces sp. LX-29]WFB07102.1 SUKH-3 domain-containing protein [Streptomyces sp. LX-29]